MSAAGAIGRKVERCQQGAWREVGEMDQMERDEWEELNDSMLALLGGMPSLILR